MKKNEIVSPSGKYKSMITEKPDGYFLDTYVLEDMGLSNCYHWIKKNKEPIYVERNYHAEAFAMDELRKFMDDPDSPLTIEWIRDFSFCKHANFLDPKEVIVYFDSIDLKKQEKKQMRIEVRTIIDFAGLCLVEELGCEGDWQMGEKDKNGEIHCWGYYGTLKQAIKGL